MSRITDALDRLALLVYPTQWKPPAWKSYLLTGDKKCLAQIPASFGPASVLPTSLAEALGAPSRLDQEGRRLLEAFRAALFDGGLADWLAGAVTGGTGRDEFDVARSVLDELGCTRLQIGFYVALRPNTWATPGGQLTGAGQYLCALPDAEIAALFERLVAAKRSLDSVGGFLARHAPAKLQVAVKAVAGTAAVTELDWAFWCAVLAQNAASFAAAAAAALPGLRNENARFEVLAQLAKFDPATHLPAAERLAQQFLLGRDSRSGRSLWCEARDAGIWLARCRGEAAMEALQEYFASALDADAWRRGCQMEYKSEALAAAVEALGVKAVPLFEACFKTDQGQVQMKALLFWVALHHTGSIAELAAHFRKGFNSDDSQSLAGMIRCAGDWDPVRLEPEFWALLAHKSRPVREAAAAAVAKLGDATLPRAAELWKARRADVRLAAVSWLRALGTDRAVMEIRARLEVEEDEDVRDALLLATEKITGSLDEPTAKELKARIRKTVGRLDGPPVSWLDLKKLPRPRMRDGSVLDADALLYLLYRQSRVREMRVDLEARPLFRAIDPASSGALAEALLGAFFSSGKADADDRWVMAFAAIVGDDRLVPMFTHRIKEWADNLRGKLAEYAVQALALLGTDAALLAVDAMAIRYRSKNKNIGKAASDAFAAAAEARGLTVEELGDLVIPWLGFEPGQRRIVEAGKAKLEVQIGSDFKLFFRDVATNKPVTKLPASLKAEFKELSAGLKEAVKSQLLRMETLMVRQFRWPAARWQELFLGHPLLLPFGRRLVWGAYDAQGKLEGTFRALEDRSLTDAADERWALAAGRTVGVVHPLELSAAARQAWSKHLADYEVVPPFGQIERPVVTVKPGQEKTVFGEEAEGTELNAMTFKGRAERLGWTRGSVCDAGCISYYVKRFPSAGVDVFLQTDGMFVGIDMESEIKLGQNFFVRHGSVQIGSYVYDEPGSADDPRLIPYGAVGPIAFSEAMGDMGKIMGKSMTAEPEKA
jgi:hypothetical protein